MGLTASPETARGRVVRSGSFCVLLLLAACGDPPRDSAPPRESAYAATPAAATATADAEALASAASATSARGAVAPSAHAQPDEGALLHEIEARLPARSYLEERCEPGTLLEGVPTKRCTYRRMGRALSVTLADVPRATLAEWILRASAAEEGATADPKTLRADALSLTDYVVAQSSGAIPLEGEVWEDMRGDGVGALYRFDRGVSEHSGTCRPMSLTAKEWCSPSVDRAACERGDFHQTCVDFLRRALASGRHDGLAARAKLLRRR